MGFSEIEVLAMFRKEPMVLRLSAEKVKKTKDILLATGKFDKCSIVHCPRLPCCSIDKRYVPHLQLLGILLASICTLSDDKFSDEFVKPYLDEVKLAMHIPR